MRAAVIAALMLSGCMRYPIEGVWSAYDRERYLRAQTARLEVGMPPEAVGGLLGQPDEVEGHICGESNPPEWKCVVWSYQLGPYREMRLFFQETRHGLLLNSWVF